MDQSPIQMMNSFHGETAWIANYPGGGTENYDPKSETDFQAGNPTYIQVLGHIGDKELVKGSESAATGAFTIEATAKPAGLQNGRSKLLRGGTSPTDTANQPFLIVDCRERRHRGQINGYTLFTAG